jgi:ketosteroid isomerase-like protein
MRRVVPALSLSLAFLASAQCGTSSSGLTASHAVAIRDSVRAALADFGRYAAAAQWDSLMRLYSADSSFRWIEDGRRGGPVAVRKAYSSLPPGLRVETTYDSTEVVPLAPGIAALTTYYRTRFVGSPTPVQYAGAISMVWTHEPGGWRIRSGHSSSGAPHATR